MRNATALDEGAELSGTVGAVLDPISPCAFAFASRREDRRTSRSRRSSPRRKSARSSWRIYIMTRTAPAARWIFRGTAQAELRDLGIAPADAALYQDLAGHLMFPHPGFRPAQSAVEENRLGQQALWTLGVSGDWPILLATIDSSVGMPSVRQLLRTHHYWRLKGITAIS